METKKVDLRNYEAKHVRQLLGFNKEYLEFVTVNDDENAIRDFLNKNYILTESQIDFLISKL